MRSLKHHPGDGLSSLFLDIYANLMREACSVDWGSHVREVDCRVEFAILNEIERLAEDIKVEAQREKPGRMA